MENRNTIAPTVAELDDIYDKLNRMLFQGKLPKAVIVLQRDDRNCYGYCTLAQVWHVGEETAYEISISSDYLHRPIIEVIGTLLHEMVHLYNAVEGVKDCSRSGKYHNTKFRDAAEGHGLDVERMDPYGYARTRIDAATERAIRKHIIGEKTDGFGLHRGDAILGESTTGEKEKKKSSSRKYVCPCCGMTIRATKEVNILCGDCMETMELES